MTNVELTIHWNSSFPNFSPISYELKNNFKQRWLRIHTLPDSKRYPEFESEYIEILRRHNLILSELFAPNNNFVLITGRYSFDNKQVEMVDEIRDLNLGQNFWLKIDVSNEDDEEPCFLNLFFDELRWSEKSLDKLFRLVANDEIRGVMLFSPDKNFVYHPYDGGADIIFNNSSQRDKYKNKFKDWLSKHPKGL